MKYVTPNVVVSIFVKKAIAPQTLREDEHIFDLPMFSTLGLLKTT